MADSSYPRTEPVSAERAGLAQRLASAARRVAPLAVVALIGSWLGFYLITPLPFLALGVFRATVIFHAVTALVFVPYLVSLIIGRRLPGGSVLDIPLVALLGVYLLTTITSLDWRVSLEVSLTALMGMGVFYVLSDGRLFRSWQVETALVLAVLAAALKALWVVGGDYADWLRLTDAVRGGVSLGDLIPATVPKVHDVGDHPNILGGILAMSLPFFLVAILRPVHVGLRALLGLGALVVIMATFLTLARSAWLGAGTGILTTAVLLLVATPAGRDLLRRLRPSTANQRWLLASMAVAVLGVGTLVGVYVVQSVEARPVWLFRASQSPRWDVIQAGAEMVRDYPLLGTGPGVFSLLYPEYSGKFPNHAFHSHNGFLQAAIDMGAPGVIAMVLVTGALGWLLIRGLRETEGGARFSIAACAGAFVAFATFSLFDAPNGFKGPLVALAAVGAVAVLSAREGRRRSGGSAGVTPARALRGRFLVLAVRMAVPIAMVGVLITWGVSLDVAHYYYRNAQTNTISERWSEALEDAQRAVDLDPEFAIYRLQLGTIYGQAYLATRDTTLLDDAVVQLERGLELEPRNAFAHVNLALLLAESGQWGRARPEAEAALEFANSDPVVALAAGTALEESNWGDEAVRAYATALQLNPILADAPFWGGSAFRQVQFPEILELSAISLNRCRLLGLSLRGLSVGSQSRDEVLSACQERVDSNPGNYGGRVVLAQVLIEDGQQDAAKDYLDYVLTRQPDHGAARTTLGSWYEAGGELEEARRQWLRAGQLDQLDALVLLGDSYPVEDVPAEVVEAVQSELRRADVNRRLVGILYYRFKFFRGSPTTILLPGEWQDAVSGRFARAEEALARWTGEE